MFMIFGVFCLAAIVHVFLLFPESCGKTLEEMEHVFAQGVWQYKVKSPPSDLEAKIQGAAKELGDDDHGSIAIVKSV